MIFLDTSAIYALADRGDPNHEVAVEAFRRLLDESEDILLHSYVLVEAAALLQRRLGLESALKFLRESQRFHIHWINSGDHEEAVGLLEERGKRGVSLVDCASFAIMRRYQVNRSLAFDADFMQEGFFLYRGSEERR
ncbi:MAG: PIN domain-containing protein [SAR202 cluster bacterium]|nr:PIN domain-containing protein [SAR202 cluster bacterium]